MACGGEGDACVWGESAEVTVPSAFGRTSAKLLKKSLLGRDNVDLPAFVAASRHFTDVLTPFGTYSKVIMQATNENVRLLAPSAKQYASAKALLQAEQQRGVVVVEYSQGRGAVACKATM